jgi:hypothetical protein
MAAHHQIIAIRPRSLANILADLKEARGDLQQALEDVKHATLGMPSQHYADIDDRATEAETRVDDLRDEFEAAFLRSTGLSVEDVLKAREEAVL